MLMLRMGYGSIFQMRKLSQVSWGSAAPLLPASPLRGKDLGPVYPGAPPPPTHSETVFKGRKGASEHVLGKCGQEQVG